MQIEKPEIQKPKRVYLTAADPDGVTPSRTITVYGATPEGIIKFVTETIAAKTKPAARNKSALTSG